MLIREYHFWTGKYYMGEQSEPHTRCSYIESVPQWYALCGEQLRSAVLRVMPRRITCRLPERLEEADKLVGGKPRIIHEPALPLREPVAVLAISLFLLSSFSL